MKSMMLIAGQYYAWAGKSTPSFDARATAAANDCGVHRAGGQHHAVAGLQLELFPVALEQERDRSVDAVEDLLVRVRVRRVAIPWAVRPRVAAARLGAQLRHQVLLPARRSGHLPDSKIGQ